MPNLIAALAANAFEALGFLAALMGVCITVLLARPPSALWRRVSAYGAGLCALLMLLVGASMLIDTAPRASGDLSAGAACFGRSGRVLEQVSPGGAHISITEWPPHVRGNPDDRYRIAGRVDGLANPEAHRIMIYALGDPFWHVQPFDHTPLTAIGETGRWNALIHGGTGYAAYVVAPDFPPKDAAALVASLPDADGRRILARLEFEGCPLDARR
jgi:hypothetical protein